MLSSPAAAQQDPCNVREQWIRYILAVELIAGRHVARSGAFGYASQRQSGLCELSRPAEQFPSPTFARQPPLWPRGFSLYATRWYELSLLIGFDLDDGRAGSQTERPPRGSPSESDKGF